MNDADPKNPEKSRHSALPGEERETAAALPEPDPEWADTQATIAELLDVTPKTIQRWLKKPGNPGVDTHGRYKIAPWQSFAVAVGRKTRSPDKAGAELEAILLKNERTRLDMEKEQGRLLSFQEVAELLASMGAAFTQRLTAARHSLGPLVVGLTVPEATKRIGSEHHAALAEVSVPDWAKKKVGPAGLFWSRASRHLSDLLRIASPGAGPSST
jgi:hypothetical protein